MSEKMENCVNAVAALLKDQEKVATPTESIALGAESILIAGVFFVLIVGVATIIYRQNKVRWNNFWGYLERHLTHAFIMVWLFGFSVYLVGTSLVEEDATFFESIGSLVWQVPMAIVHAFEMFVLESDVSAIHGKFHESLFFMSCFSLAHFLAVFVSLTFIIKYFGYNLVAKFKLFYTSRFKGHFDDLYVFWGMNQATYCLAKDGKYLTFC